MSRKHKANLQPPSEAYRGLDQALSRKKWPCTAAPITPTYCLTLIQQTQNALLIQDISKIARQQGLMREPEQTYDSTAWQDELTSVMFEMCISMMSLYTPDSGTRDWILAGPGLGYISLQDQELLLSCIKCCNILHHLTSLVHGLQASLPPSPNYFNKQPGHIYDSLKIMMIWPKSFYSDILAVSWA